MQMGYKEWIAIAIALIVVASFIILSNCFYGQQPAPPPIPGPTPPPRPPPIYILAKITVEATVLDVNKTFVSHYEGYSGTIPPSPPYPTPAPPPHQPM